MFYCTLSFCQDIKKLLIEWSGHLKSCDSIFLRAPGSNQKSLFAGKDSPLNKHDVRLHMVPFPTRRPTFNEVKRVHEILATVYCYGLCFTILSIIHVKPFH